MAENDTDESNKKSPVREEEKYIIIKDDGKKKTSELIAKIREHYPFFYYNEKKVDEEFPAPAKPTSRKFLLSQDSDEDLADKSTEDLERGGIQGITFRERLIYELLYYKRTGEHLDINTATLCSGSRFPDGRIPRVHWSSNAFHIDETVAVMWCSPEVGYKNLRSRRAFLLDTAT